MIKLSYEQLSQKRWTQFRVAFMSKLPGITEYWQAFDGDAEILIFFKKEI